MQNYKEILGHSSLTGILAHRKLLSAKVECTNGRTKANYKECIAMVDNALMQVFDLVYANAPEDTRIGDLLSFWDEIDRIS